MIRGMVMETSEAYYKLLEMKSDGIKRNASTVIDMAEKLNRIPESYFYVKIWPIVKSVFEGGTPLPLGEWLNISGGLLNELIVEDDDTKQEIFRVPAYNCRSTPMELTRDNDGEVGHRVMTPDDLVERQEVCRLNGDFRGASAIEETLSTLYATPVRSMRVEDFANLVTIWNRYEAPLEDLFGDDVEDVLALVGEYVKEIEGADAPEGK